jgi:anti-sigma B factor antagonist
MMDINTADGIRIVHLARRIDSDNAPEVELLLKGLIDQGAKKIVCDFSHTDYINSSGLRVLLSANKRIIQAGGRMALSSLNPSVRQVFEVAGFTRIFSVFPTSGDAAKGIS